MPDKRTFILRLLLNRYHPAGQESLLKALPLEDATRVSALTLDAADPAPALLRPILALDKIHYSWLVPRLKELPKSKAFLLSTLLTEPQASKVRKALNIQDVPTITSSSIKAFLARQLIPELGLTEILPLEYLPKTALTPLAHLNKKELVALIDLMGLYDLAQEIHQIVNKKILENVYHCLSKSKTAYLKQCLHTREKLVTQRLHLEQWDGNAEKLMKLLHHRGMVRLAYGLSGQNAELNWHIIHILDSGRGEKLNRLINPTEITGVTPTLKKHIQNAVQFLKGE